MKNYKNTLGNWIANKRQSIGLTQKELAQVVGITRGTVSNFENDYATPSPEVLSDIAFALSY